VYAGEAICNDAQRGGSPICSFNRVLVYGFGASVPFCMRGNFVSERKGTQGRYTKTSARWMDGFSNGIK